MRHLWRHSPDASVVPEPSEKSPYYFSNSPLIRAGEKVFDLPMHVADYYMTMLANAICEEKSIALVSDDGNVFGLSEACKLDGWRGHTSKRPKSGQ